METGRVNDRKELKDHLPAKIAPSNDGAARPGRCSNSKALFPSIQRIPGIVRLGAE